MAECRPGGKTGFLDSLRGSAAVYVLLHHAFLWLHSGYRYGYLRHPEEFSWAEYAILLASRVFRFGHEAVLFFFVLSGFVIHLRYASKAAAGMPLPQRDWSWFLWRRALRLYPPLLAAILITWIADRSGSKLGYAIYFGHTPYPIINQTIGVDHSLRTLLGNLAFLMQTYVPVWGTDAPLWSLKFEWWFYFLYPMFWPLLRKSAIPATILVACLFALSFIRPAWPLVLLRDVFSGMLIWWLGALVAEIYTGRLAIKFSWIAPLTTILPIGVILGLANYEIPELAWGLGFAGALALGFEVQRRGVNLLALEKMKPLGDCSYTLYVIHAPLLIFASGWLMARSPTGELPVSFRPALCCLAIVPLAYVLHFVVERPFISRRSPGQRPKRDRT